jgi:hypothetical protein
VQELPLPENSCDRCFAATVWPNPMVQISQLRLVVKINRSKMRRFRLPMDIRWGALTILAALTARARFI